jgi:NADP-dependent 3-hydroxy acid dehydrogenase YdfG
LRGIPGRDDGYRLDALDGVPHTAHATLHEPATASDVVALCVSTDADVTGAVYSGTKYAAWAITEGLRQESDRATRVTTISPGVVTSELADSITEDRAAKAMRTYRAHAIEPDVIAGAVSYALTQPADLDVNEIVLRPARQR